jgi:hypothetical protein
MNGLVFHSPLVLHVVALAFHGRRAYALEEGGSLAERQRRLFQAYVERMLEQRPVEAPARLRMMRYLSWLAQSMRDREQSEFHLDRLQPDWLPTRIQQRLVIVVPAVIVGLIAGSLFGLAAHVDSGTLFSLTGGCIYGLAFGLSFWIYTKLGVGSKYWQADGHKRDSLRILSKRVNRLTVFSLVFGVTFGLFCGLVFSFAAGLLGGVLFGSATGMAMTLSLSLAIGLSDEDTAIQPIEEVRWSWSARTGWLTLLGLGFGTIGGLALGSIFTIIAYGLVAALIVAIFFGLGGGLSDKRTIPNEGIHRSARYALILGSIFGLICGPWAGLLVGLERGLSSGQVAGVVFGLLPALYVALLFGGLACLRHMTLRVLLVHSQNAPLRYIAFLDDAAERLLLRRSGSAYLFVHRSLLEYFADLDVDRVEAARSLSAS